MRTWMAACVAATGLLLGAAPALAQSVGQTTHHRPVYATQEYDAWTFAPVLIEGEVKGFFCFINTSELVGDNIPLVWYDKNADGTWTMYGWSHYTVGPAVKWLQEYYGSEALFANCPALCRVVQGDTVAQTPKNMTEGLFEDDPMHQLINSADDPVAAMSLLEAIGWEAAPGLSTVAVAVDDTCVPEGEDALKKLLDESAYKMEVILTGVATISVDCFSFGCTGCVKNYDPMVADSNASWIFRYSSTPASFPDDKFCYYDFPATQHWWMSGQKTSCAECTGEGTNSTFIMKTVRVGRNEECHPPSGTP